MSVRRLFAIFPRRHTQQYMSSPWLRTIAAMLVAAALIGLLWVHDGNVVKGLVRAKSADKLRGEEHPPARAGKPQQQRQHGLHGLVRARVRTNRTAARKATHAPTDVPNSMKGESTTLAHVMADEDPLAEYARALK